MTRIFTPMLPEPTQYKLTRLPLAATQQFRATLLDYVAVKPALAPFYAHPPTLEGLRSALEAKKNFSPAIRADLVTSITALYTSAGVKVPTERITFLGNANTYTITTGHQLSIFGGPLYLVFKALTAINLAKAAKAAYPEFDFVPMFWLSGEDHDLDEIRTVRIFGRDLTWATQQQGPTGPMQTEGLAEVLAQINGEKPEWLTAYTQAPTLMAAQVIMMENLFGHLGLVVIDGRCPELKRHFKHTILKEITESFSYPKLQQQTADLEKAGYKAQIGGREINLFYMKPGLRARIVRTEGGFEALEHKTFTHDELVSEAETHPEHFSPNVVLRPVYEETILPNLAYIGGPAEVAYWLQLRTVFEAAGVNFPAVWPRQSALYVPASLHKKWKELGFTPSDWFRTTPDLKAQYLDASGAGVKLDAEWELWHKLFAQLEAKAREADKTVGESVAADKARLEKQVEGTFKKIEKAYERRHEQVLTQIEKTRERLMPGGGLQERSENFLTYYLSNPDWVNQIAQHIDPTRHEFNIIEEVAG